MKILGRAPTVGGRFPSGGLQFEVVDMDQNRMGKLLVTRLDHTNGLTTTNCVACCSFIQSMHVAPLCQLSTLQRELGYNPYVRLGTTPPLRRA